MTTETITLDTRPMTRSAGWRRAVLGFAVALAALGVLGLAFAVGLAVVYEGRAMPGVSVGGVSLSGLEREAAKVVLRAALPSLAEGQAVLTLDGESRSVAYAALGRDYDLDAMLDAAFAVGHTGTPAERAREEIRALVRGVAVAPVVRYDHDAARRRLDIVAASLRRPAVDAGVALPEGSVFFEAIPAVAGRTADVDAALAALDDALARADPGDATVALLSTPVEPDVTTAMAERAALRATTLAATDLTLAAGPETLTIANETVRQWILFAQAADGTFGPTVDMAKVDRAIAGIARRFDRLAVNARYQVSGRRIVGIVPGIEGRTLDEAASAARVRDAIASPSAEDATPRVELAMTFTPPAFSTADAKAWRTRMKPTATGHWRTKFPVGERNFFGKNIAIPTSTINGYVVAPGEWFDFWTVVGELSRAKGYGPGGAIINGHTKPTGALAGGICSCSTTLFNAAVRYGLEMGARRNHYYYITRYPLGLDATVYKSDGGNTQTMSFRNDTANPILIVGLNAYGLVTFELWSEDVGRKVSFSTPIVRNVRPARSTIEYTTTLPPGATKQVEHPADGKDVWVTRIVRDAHGTIIHRETWYSHYARVDGLTLIGKAAEAGSPTVK